MEIYHYDRDTFELKAVSEAKLDPREGKPMIPAFATTLVPPEATQNKVAVFISGAWKLVDDFRQVKYWKAWDTMKTIENLGETPPPEATMTPPPQSNPELYDLVQKQWVLNPERNKEFLRRGLQNTRDSLLSTMVHEVEGVGFVQVRPQDYLNFTSRIAAGVAREWVLADNTVAILTVAQMQECLDSGMAQAAAIWDNYIVELQALNASV